MAALHKKERAQAVQILQLRQDLERAKSTADSATRELAELNFKRINRAHAILADGGLQRVGSSPQSFTSFLLPLPGEGVWRVRARVRRQLHFLGWCGWR